MNEIPVIPVTFTSKTKKIVIFYCEFCKTTHTHGTAVAGHRIAHCTNPDSPYRKTGYILRMPEVIKPLPQT